MSVSRKRRRYREVGVVARDGLHGVALDGKALATPGGQPLLLPQRALAEAVAAEWRAQGEQLDAGTMPLTRLASSAIDVVAPHRAAVIERTAAYAATDLLCYRAHGPAILASRQEAGWQPLVDWVERHYGAPLRVTAGIVAIAQPAASLAVLRRAVEAADPWRLTALAAATAACGSLVLGLALAEGEIDAAAATALSLLDESYQSERWGEDPEALKRRAALSAEIAAAARFLALLAD